MNKKGAGLCPLIKSNNKEVTANFVLNLYFNLKGGHFWTLLNAVDSNKMFNINFASDWIRTADLWYQKRQLYQLSRNHCQTKP